MFAKFFRKMFATWRVVGEGERWWWRLRGGSQAEWGQIPGVNFPVGEVESPVGKRRRRVQIPGVKKAQYIPTFFLHSFNFNPFSRINVTTKPQGLSLLKRLTSTF